MNATVRIVQPTDFERLLRLYARFEPKEVYDGQPPLALADIETWLKEFLHDDFVQFVVEIGDRIVGHSVLHLSRDRTEAELMLFVHQEFRGLGLGRALFLGTLNHGCKHLRLDRVIVKIDTANPIAQGRLERVGFRARDLNKAFQMEGKMERPSNCPKCKAERCQIFNTPLPTWVRLPQGVLATQPRWSSRLVDRVRFT